MNDLLFTDINVTLTEFDDLMVDEYGIFSAFSEIGMIIAST